MKRRRTAFASPFVVTMACGGTPPPTVNPPPPVPEDAATIDAIPVDAEMISLEVPDAAPPAPPDAAVASPGALVVQPYSDGPCYLVYKREMRGRTSRTHFDEGQVPCPPNVKLPDPQRVTINNVRYQLDLETLECHRELPGNPPSWRTSPCPPQLLPELVGLTPDEKCEYRGVVVSAPNCNPKPPPEGHATKARVIAASVVADGVRVVLSVGTDAGVTPGAIVRMRGEGVARITACNARTCEAVFHATMDQVRRESLVTID